MKRKRGARQDRFFEIVLLLGAIFPLATCMFYVLNLFPLAILTFCLAWVFGEFSVIILIAVAIDRVMAIFFDKKPKHHDKRLVSTHHFVLVDDGEIIEIADDQKPKRGGDVSS